MVEDARLFEVFLEVQRGLPRQGPGCAASTLQAVALCRELPENPAVLDIGCGPGMQTVVLSRTLDGEIVAVDINREYLAELRDRVRAEGVADRVDILIADMNRLPFRRESFDLIWSEGAAYIMGFANALVAWKQYLKPGGYIGVTELVWLRPNPPALVGEFFGREYPAMTDPEAILETFRASGYEPWGHFTLSDSAWWEHYYGPLAAKLPDLSAKYAEDPTALAVVEAARQEIEMRRRLPDGYGYEFFVARRGE